MINEDRAIELLVTAMTLCKKIDPWVEKYPEPDYPGYPTPKEKAARDLYWTISEELGILTRKDAYDQEMKRIDSL